MSMITITATTTPALRRGFLHLAANTRRFLNHAVAAAIAYREREARLCALYRLEHTNLDNTRIYRSPIDQAVEKAAQFRRQRRRA
ncbi:MAG: hypothetical protein ABW175_15850 [Bradyrhizobium sp.]